MKRGLDGQSPLSGLVEAKQWPLVSLCFSHFLSDSSLARQYLKIANSDVGKYILKVPSSLSIEFVKLAFEEVSGIKDQIIPLSAEGNVKFVDTR